MSEKRLSYITSPSFVTFKPTRLPLASRGKETDTLGLKPSIRTEKSLLTLTLQFKVSLFLDELDTLPISIGGNTENNDIHLNLNNKDFLIIVLILRLVARAPFRGATHLTQTLFLFSFGQGM